MRTSTGGEGGRTFSNLPAILASTALPIMPVPPKTVAQTTPNGLCQRQRSEGPTPHRETVSVQINKRFFG